VLDLVKCKGKKVDLNKMRVGGTVKEIGLGIGVFGLR